MHFAKDTKITKIYDEYPIRYDFQPDPLISRLISHIEGQIFILDIACGTGNYLLSQTKAFSDKRITWYGYDLSQDMVDIAKAKLPSSIIMTKGNADLLPYSDNNFDFISCNFAFHHFKNKHKCVSEMYRVLKLGGTLSIHNINPYSMPQFWLYKYFPHTERIDKKRFWNDILLYQTLTDIGFKVYLKTTIEYKAVLIEELIQQAENRNISQLNMISDYHYNKGITKLHNALKVNNRFNGQMALTLCEAAKVK